MGNKSQKKYARDFLAIKNWRETMYKSIKKWYAVVLSAIFIGVIPGYIFAQELPMLPQPMEMEGRVKYVRPYYCTYNHKYWCGRITGVVWIHDKDGKVFSRYVKTDTPMYLNGDSISFEEIKRGDKAKVVYFEGETWASMLELERWGS
jgi:hypothetical protein